jgi:primosomal protein N' (replication factor Y)
MAITELNERKAFGYPPYSHLTRILIRHTDYNTLHRAAHALADILRKKFGTRIMGPVSSSLEMLRGEHRAELLLKIESGASMKRARMMISDVVEAVRGDERYRNVTLIVDVDAW